jgi:hypothetical protein
MDAARRAPPAAWVGAAAAVRPHPPSELGTDRRRRTGSARQPQEAKLWRTGCEAASAPAAARRAAPATLPTVRRAATAPTAGTAAGPPCRVWSSARDGGCRAGGAGPAPAVGAARGTLPSRRVRCSVVRLPPHPPCSQAMASRASSSRWGHSASPIAATCGAAARNCAAADAFRWACGRRTPAAPAVPARRSRAGPTRPPPAPRRGGADPGMPPSAAVRGRVGAPRRPHSPSRNSRCVASIPCPVDVTSG